MKSSHHLLHNQANKGYGSIPGLTPPTSLHACLQRLTMMQIHLCVKIQLKKGQWVSNRCKYLFIISKKKFVGLGALRSGAICAIQH